MSNINIDYLWAKNDNLVSQSNIASHGKEADPDYNTVFKQDEVIRIDIKVAQDNWEQIEEELGEMNSGRGDKPMMPPPHGDMQKNRPGPPAQNQGVNPNLNNKNAAQKQGMPMPPPDMMNSSDVSLSYIECDVYFNGETWNHVGLRVKGNSSLRAAQQSQAKKFSFKLDFDEFEDDFPAIKNQRFYGFKQLNLNNNYKDASLIREKVASDLFREFDVPSAKTTLCTVYLDKGNGPEFHGIYTLVEEVDDTVIETQFTSGKGNLYKPDGNAATFREGSFDEENMCVKTNKKTCDYADVKAFYNLVNSSASTQKSSEWRAQLEHVFDVDGFLKWYAANNVMQNWDVYGQSPHNYYLYFNPENGLLTWIPWDNNEALMSHPRLNSTDLNLIFNDQWPIIKSILSHSEYKAKYDAYVKQFSTEVFSPAKMKATYKTYYNMLKPFVEGEVKLAFSLRDTNDFNKAFIYLNEHVQLRSNIVTQYLNN